MVLFLFLVIFAAVHADEDFNEAKAKEFLTRFGYYNPFAFDGSTLEDSIKEYQRFYQLEVTGLLDKATVEMMEKPRCGVPDRGTHDSNAYYLQCRRCGRWRSPSLTYSFDNFGEGDLSVNTVRQTIQRAFNAWSAVTPLKFREVRARANLRIGFYKGNHRDGDGKFTGRGGVLAHAFFPTRGLIHFDDYEYWVVNRRGTDFYEIAVHEIGHALGLDHSRVRGTIMYATYFGYRHNLQLHSDDIAGIRSIYGSSGGAATNPKPPVTSCRDNNQMCAAWMQKGECSNNKRYMHRHCKLSCGVCRK